MNHIQAKSFLFIQFVTHFYKKRASLVAHMVKNLPSVQETGSIAGLGRPSGEGDGNPPQYCCLEKSKDRGAWLASSWGHKELDTTE